MALLARADEVPDATVAMKTFGDGGLSTKQVFGTSVSLMLARRTAGYHSKPHIHNCEQLNYLLEGEMWIFVEDDAFRLRQGDFLRVPTLKVHWAWNRSDEDCVLIEAHSPGLDLLPRDKTVDLLDPKEPNEEIIRVPQLWASTDYATEGEAKLTY